MNKTLLLIICDFLLLNLLALTRWDTPIAAPVPEQEKPLSLNHTTNPAATKDQDLVDVMKLSLQDEQVRRNELTEQLAARTQDVLQLAEARKQLEGERQKLATNLESTQRTAAATQQQLQQQIDTATRDAGVSKERLAQLQRDLESREADLARANTQVSKLEQSQVDLQQKNENLNVAVKVAEQEKGMLRATADTLRTQVETERQDRIKVQESTKQLAQGVGNLAGTTASLTQEIRDNRPINTNTLYNEYLSNNVSVRFDTARPGLFGTSTKTVELRTVLVSDGKDTYAIFHTDDTPLALGYPGADLTKLTVTLTKGNYSTTVAQVNFLSLDPRILVVPLTAQQVSGLGVKTYMTTLEPFKFPDAMLVSIGGGKYEETPFKLDASQPSFVQMKVSFFSSKRGDLAISKTGELLGIMVNKDYCALVNNFLPAKTLATGDDTSAQGIGSAINTLFNRVRTLPSKLQ